MKRPLLSLVSSYLDRLAALERRGDAREESFYPALESLLTDWARTAGHPDVHVTTIPRRTQGCCLDFQVWRGHRLVGYVEAKRPGTDLDQAEQSPQLKRYKDTFPNLILTDFRELRLYRSGDRIGSARISRSDTAAPDELLEVFFGSGAPPRPGAPFLAKALAARARILQGRVEDLLRRDHGREEPSALTGLYRALESNLFTHLPEKDFADLYAQTVAYGLLAARCWEDGDLDRRTLYERIPPSSGILRDIFRYISLSPPTEIEWILDDLVDLLRPAELKRILDRHFHRTREREDPMLHFYETFLRHYDLKRRKQHGVFYTPPAVVSYIVRSIDRILRTRLDRPDGLADQRVRLLDPAAGTTTFLVEAFRCAISGWEAAHGKAGVPALVRDHLLPHCFGFELMVAPYAVGHLKMALFLLEKGYTPGADERVHLLLTNTLEEERSPGQLSLLPALAREIRKAAEVKADRRISVVLGNPPWSGHSAHPTERKDDPLRRSHAPGDEGYYQIDGRPLNEKGSKWLQDDYVKFLRFAQRKIDEAGEGVAGLVLNHSYLDNSTFRGLRRSLMNSFDQMYLLDLHGNRRKREAAPDGGPDENVFDIEQGVSILLLVKKPGLERRIAKADLYGNRRKKIRFLEDFDVDSTRWTDLQPRPPGYLFMPRDARREQAYARGIPLTEIFLDHSVGVLTARDAFVIELDPAGLREKIVRLRSGLLPEELVSPDYPLDTGSWKLAEAVKRARADRDWEKRFTEILFRPLDYRPIFYADYLVERTRDRLMRHLVGGRNLALVLPRQSKDGFGALVANRIVAHKAVGAYDINHVFPLYLLEDGMLPRRPNLTPGILRRLESLLGEPPEPETVLAYVYAVLYSEEYRSLYGAFLALDFPRIPLPADPRVFHALAALGKELIDLHLPDRPLPSTVRFLGEGSGKLGHRKRALRNYRPDEQRVYVNEEGQYFDGIPERVWEYRIGGYQVLDRWLQDRAGRTLTFAEIQAFPRIATALRRTLDVQRRIDEIYPSVDAA